MKRTLLVAAILMLSAGLVRAQYDETNNLFYNTFRTPQSNLLNPAFFPQHNLLYLTLPSIGLQYGGPLGISDLVRLDKAANRLVINFNDIADRLNSDNRFHLGADCNLAGFGLRISHLFINANVRAVADATFGFPRSTINALMQGNVDNQGNAIEQLHLVEGDLFSGQAYLEGSIGGGYYIESLGLTIGAHAKLLYGLACAHTNNTAIDINTSPDFDSVSADVYYELMQSACVAYDTALGELVIDRGNLLDLRHQNLGLAFDIGARYVKGPLTLSFAINDLSTGIHWRYNTNVFAPEGGHTHLVFDGLDSDDIDQSRDSDEGSSWTSRLVDGLSPEHTQGDYDYYFGIPTKINLGATFSLGSLFRAGLVLHGRWDRGLLTRASGASMPQCFRFNATATAGVQLLRRIELIAGTSFVYDGSHVSLFNPGAGLVLSPFSALQFYLMADYISDLYLVEAKAFRMSFGFNILIGGGSNK